MGGQFCGWVDGLTAYLSRGWVGGQAACCCHRWAAPGWPLVSPHNPKIRLRAHICKGSPRLAAAAALLSLVLRSAHRPADRCAVPRAQGSPGSALSSGAGIEQPVPHIATVPVPRRGERCSRAHLVVQLGLGTARTGRLHCFGCFLCSVFARLPIMPQRLVLQPLLGREVDSVICCCLHMLSCKPAMFWCLI